MEKPTILLIDNYDSFTYNLYDYFLQLGVSCLVLRNDESTLADIRNLNFDALVFSPGPQKPKDAGLLMDVLNEYHDRLPILGICLGHQAIGEYFGATLTKAALPVHGKANTITHQNHPLFHDLPSQFKVMRYHSLILEHIAASPLQEIAQTEAGEIMAIAHPLLPICGVQFHPESILTEHGLAMLENWLAHYLKNYKRRRTSVPTGPKR